MLNSLQIAQRRLEPRSHTVADDVQAKFLCRSRHKIVFLERQKQHGDDLKGRDKVRSAFVATDDERTHVVVALEVMESGVASKDRQDGVFQLDSQAISVVIANICKKGISVSEESVRLDGPGGVPWGKLTRLRSMSRRT